MDFYIENSVFSSITNYYDNDGGILCHIEARNSIIGVVMRDYGGWGYHHVVNSSFTNCFLFMSIGFSYPGSIDGSNQVFYCVGLGSNIFSQSLGGSAAHTNIEIENISDFFKTFDGYYSSGSYPSFIGSYNDNETFELTAAAQTTFLGDDGTQIGIYGGSMPFDPKPNNPYITKLTVAEKSTPQGTLSVDIQVQPAQ